MKNEVNVLFNLSHPTIHGSAINHLRQGSLQLAIFIRQGQKIRYKLVWREVTRRPA
jgi:hypothetical protein